MKLFDTTLTRLQESLDVRLVEHNVLAGNIANADTPGYRPKELDFAQAMAAAQRTSSADAMRGTDQTSDPNHLGLNGAAVGQEGGAMGAAASLVREGGTGNPSLDGNDVDIDRTMAGLAENALQYGASARAAGKKLAILRYVITEGNG